MQKEDELVGIDRNWIIDGIIGLSVGIAILLVGFLVPGIGTIGIPSLPQSLSSDVSKFIVVVLLASIFETFGFFDVILSFFYNKTRRFGLKMPFVISAVLTSITFSLFHLSAYQSFSASSGAFVTAFIMGLVFSYERRITLSNIPGVLTHMVLNFWLAFGSLAIVFG